MNNLIQQAIVSLYSVFIRLIATENLIFICIIYLIGIFLDTSLIHQKSLLEIGKVQVLTYETAEQARYFAVWSSLWSVLTAMLSTFLIVRITLFGAWSMYEPMFYEHPDFPMLVTMGVLFMAYMSLLLPIWQKLLYILYKRVSLLCGTKTAGFVFVVLIGILAPFGLADCAGFDMSPAVLDSDFSTGIESTPNKQDVGSQTGAPPDPGPQKGSGKFLDWLLALCAELGISPSPRVLAAIQDILWRLMVNTGSLVISGLSAYLSWAILSYFCPQLAAEVVNFFQLLLDKLSLIAQKLEILIKIQEGLKKIETDNEEWPFYRALVVLVALLRLRLGKK